MPHHQEPINRRSGRLLLRGIRRRRTGATGFVTAQRQTHSRQHASAQEIQTQSFLQTGTRVRRGVSGFSKVLGAEALAGMVIRRNAAIPKIGKFLDASSHLYKRVCASVRMSVTIHITAESREAVCDGNRTMLSFTILSFTSSGMFYCISMTRASLRRQRTIIDPFPSFSLFSEEYSIFVGDLTDDVDDYDLYKTFKDRYPSTRGAKVVLESNGESRGFGFVRFSNTFEQTSALRVREKSFGNTV